MFVVRSYGYRYEDGRCYEDLCYVTEDGSLTTFPLDAKYYESEAEAWEHVLAAGYEAEDIEAVEEI